MNEAAQYQAASWDKSGRVVSKGFIRGFKPLWSQLNSFCTFTGLIPIQKIKIDIY